MEALYDIIGHEYDTTRKADPCIVESLCSHLNLKNERSYIDIGCGTGNYTIELSRVNGNWVGVDASSKMIEAARKKYENIEWKVCDVVSLPYKTQSFEGAVCVLAIHHFESIRKAFREIGRVISKGGVFVIFTALPSQLEYYWLNEYFPSAMRRSAKQLPGWKEIKAALESAGFEIMIKEPFFITPELKDFFLYSGKQRPEMYLSRKVRSGISTFSNLASEEEIELGVTKLTKDIESGYIQKVIQSYPGGQGDYLFIQAKKI